MLALTIWRTPPEPPQLRLEHPQLWGPRWRRRLLGRVLAGMLPLAIGLIGCAGLAYAATPTPAHNFRSTGVTSTTASFAWDPASGQAYYYVWKGNADWQTGWVRASPQLPASATSYTVTGLTPSTTYSWCVRAYDSSGSSVPSNCIQTKTASSTSPSPTPTPSPDPAPVPAPTSGRTLKVGPGAQFSTVQAAADAAQPGDNVEIASGTYSGPLTIKTSGTPGNYITFYGKDGPAIIDGNGSTGGWSGLLAVGSRSWLRFVNVAAHRSSGYGLMANGASNLVFRNFTLDGSQQGGMVFLSTSNILIDGCEVRGSNAAGLDANHEALSIGDGSSNAEVRGCSVHNNGEEGIDIKYTVDTTTTTKVHDNIAYANRGPNIYVDSTSNVDIYNNTTSGTTGATKAGIGLAVENWSGTGKLDHVRVFNNVSYGNAAGGLSFWTESTGTLSNVSVINNTFYGNATGDIDFATRNFSGTNIIRNNVFAHGASNSAFTADHNYVATTSDFVNQPSADFHLRAGSRAIDAGSPTGAPAFDKDGRARPAGAGVDAGAYER